MPKTLARQLPAPLTQCPSKHSWGTQFAPGPLLGMAHTAMNKMGPLCPWGLQSHEETGTWPNEKERSRVLVMKGEEERERGRRADTAVSEAAHPVLALTKMGSEWVPVGKFLML